MVGLFSTYQAGFGHFHVKRVSDLRYQAGYGLSVVTRVTDYPLSSGLPDFNCFS
jgi:hypothetical protein